MLNSLIRTLIIQSIDDMKAIMILQQIKVTGVLNNYNKAPSAAFKLGASINIT